MKYTRMFFIALSVFVVFMLIKQFIDYNRGLTASAHGPADAHYFYNMPVPPEMRDKVAPPPPSNKPPIADVRQVAYWTDQESGHQLIHASIVAKNIGTAKAVGVEVCVKPYYGAQIHEEGGRQPNGRLSDHDPLTQISQWVTMPDLMPGESATQTIAFVAQPGVPMGNNPQPQIIFSTVVP